ncbi:hypothetical protein EGW08_011117 [Elysia chlorotica]|uniref:Gfo/Idh/MocA-like oxidoreductase N-terminal domain-containing protein n=1 Tax=Elysia chlorotica TaxID=188477 RepID=A0A433THZ9_ELYCH|nr:hypothetical protein EGW08_011117 [Elysia chlorotica]
MDPQSQNEIGVVVVGLGRAGIVRVRDLKAKNGCLTLKGVVSRRKNEDEEVPQLSLEEALDRTDVKAVIISTEPALHEEYIRLALEKGKHVLVEYPLALTAATARELFQSAEDKGLILYEENIALLVEGFLAVKEKSKLVDLKQASYSLAGSYNGWIEDFEGSGLPFVCGISGIQIMLSLFGDLLVKGGKIDHQENGYMAQASLETQKGRPITLTLARSKDTKRIKQEIYEFEDGDVLDPSKIVQKSSKPGLFMQDLENFEKIVGKGKLPDECKWLSIRGLEIAEQIHSFF